jgi:uncharacterized protein YjiS (DUF1127 family)
MRSAFVIAAGRSTSAVAVEWSRILRRTAAMARFGWRAYWRWRYRQMTLRLLRSMDEPLLRDMGVNALGLQSFLAKSEPRSTNPFGN